MKKRKRMESLIWCRRRKIMARTASERELQWAHTMSALIKCPPYCRTNCAIKHHPLLVALLNCRDTEEKIMMNLRLNDVHHVVKNYKQRGNWDIADDIPDAAESYRMPLGHWACNLGRIAAMEWLVDNGFPPETKSRLSGDTCLHRALIRLLESCPRDASSKFQLLLQILHPALSVGNKYGNTPLHICCDMLQKGMPRRDFYARAITMILSVIQSQPPEVAQLLLNARNDDEDTPLHLLAKAGGSLSSIQQLVAAGCEVDLSNAEGLTPIEIAVNNSHMRTAMYLDSVLRAQSKTHKMSAYMKQIREDQAKTQEPCTEPKRTKELTAETVQNLLIDMNKALGRQSDDTAQGKRTARSDLTSNLMDVKRAKLSRDSEEKAESQDVGIVINMQVPTNDTDSDGGTGTASMAISITDDGDGLLSFLTECEEKLKDHILLAIRGALQQDVKSLEVLDEKNKAIKEKLEAHQNEELATVTQVENLMQRLTGLQREEAHLRGQLTHVQKEVGSSTFQLVGLRERLSHCDAALSALSSIK